MSAPKLFSPGPVMVKDNVRSALLHYDICHRSEEFEDMFADTQEKIRWLFRADDSYYPVIISGSGTSANETVLSSLFRDGESVLLIRNGLFGERLLEIIDKYGIPKVDVAFPWGTYPDLKVIERALEEHPEVTAAAMVFHETSTGMINPAGEIGTLCRRYGKLLYADCVSAAGGEFVNVAENNIDVATSVGGKCVGAFPGSAYICAKKAVLDALTPEQCKNVYLSLYKHYATARAARQTPNTPTVNLFWPLNTALGNIMEETLEGRVARCQACAKIIRQGLTDLGMRLLLSEHMSNTVTSVFLPEGIDAPAFLKEMEARGYIFYIGKGDYAAQNLIQVANMGEIYPQDCENMLRVMEECLRTMGRKQAS